MNDDLKAAKINRVTAVLLLAFMAVALSLVYWSVVRAGAILARDDNPRLVETELRIQRGQIVDKNGIMLADTVGQPDRLDRIYPIAQSGPAVGYYSFRHGTAGVEAGFDAVLRGETADFNQQLRRQVLHEAQTGQAIQLTLDAVWQQTADSLLPNTPSALIVLALNGDTAPIMALVSHPGYDPNLLNEQFDDLTEDASAPLLNRVTQGQYQPGLLLQPFILATGIEEGLLNMADLVEAADTAVPLNGNSLTCMTAPETPISWSQVLTHRCPAPMMQLADQLGSTGLDQIFTNFGLTTAPQLPLNTETPPLEPLADPLLAGVGQDNLLVTPLQVALAWAALGGNGRLPTPQLVTAVQDENGNWRPQPMGEREAVTPVSALTVQTMRRHLHQTDDIIEYSTLVLSGPEGEMNGWYLGLFPANAPRYAVVVVVEDSTDLGVVEAVGRGLITAVAPAP
jgi:peptidoglycan glycosyltransferase